MRFPGIMGNPKLLTIADKQRNRQMRNDVDARAAISGVSWQQGEKMWRDKFGKKGAKLSLMNNTHLQQIYNLMGSGKKAASAPSAPAPAPAKSTPLMPTISQASKDYRAKTKELLAKVTKARDEFNSTEAAAIKAREIAEKARVRDFAIQRSNAAKDFAIQRSNAAKADQLRSQKEKEIAAQNEAVAKANEMRSNQTLNFKIQPASQTSTTGGTQSFKRRKLNRFLTGISGLVNI